MKVLMTGGTGYVGSHLRDYVREEGHDVRLLIRRESTHKVGPASGFEVTEGDILNTNACLRACDGVDAVVHLVGLIREDRREGVTFDEMHRVATHNIVDAARRSGVERFVHMSALGTRADAASEYHRTKFAAEQIVQSCPMRWTIFRPSFTFARGDLLSRRIKELLSRPIVPLIDGGKSRLQPVALEDVCRCMASALAMPETQGQIYELGGPDRLTFRDLVGHAAVALNRGLKTMSVPAWAVRPAVAALQRFMSFPLTLDQLKMLVEDNVCEIDHYVKTFEIEPKSFLKALPNWVS